MKKKENLWELLQRLDEEAGQFNFHLNEANRYFDNSALATKKILEKHERTIAQIDRESSKIFKNFSKAKKDEVILWLY
jgi:hypothetical protein